MGCLTLPFRMLGCLGLLILLAAGWLYRDRVELEVRRFLAPTSAPVETSTGRPAPRPLRDARAKLAALAKGDTDRVTLDAGEMASLIREGLEPAVRERLDSMRVRLEDGAIEVSARVDTRHLPRESLGPLAYALRDREQVRAAGPVRVLAPGRGAWEITRLQVRDLPLPKDLVPRLLGRLGDGHGSAVPLTLPRGVRDLRIRPDGVTLYGTRSP